MLQFLLSADEITKLKKKRDKYKQQQRWYCEFSNEVTFTDQKDNPLGAVSSLHLLRMLVLPEGRKFIFFPSRCASLKPAHSSSSDAAPILNFSSSLASGG